MMNTSILVITNNFQSSLTYTHILMGYGYQVDEVQTFVGARVRLRAGLLPAVIIIDVKFHDDEKEGFINHLSHYHPGIPTIVIGQSDSLANIIILKRPVNPESIINTIQNLELA